MNISNLAWLLLLPVLSYCTAETNDNKYKYAAIEKILKKVSNITMDHIAQAPLDEKPKILRAIERKLNKSAIALGAKGHKYLELLMHGVKLIAYNNTKLEQKDDPISDSTTEFIHSFRSGNETISVNEYSKKDKEQLVKDIANKIESLAGVYLKAAKTAEERKAAVETIKKKILDSANKKHILIHNKHEEIKHYSDLISQGLNLMMDRILKNDSRRMEIEFYVNKDDDLTGNKNGKLETISNKLDEESDCSNISEKNCQALYDLGTFSCVNDPKSIPLDLDRLCNDIFDCPDHSDEKNCVHQGIEKIHKAINIMSQIESPQIQNCFVVQLASLTKQNKQLRLILDHQLNFIQKYNNISLFSNSNIHEKQLSIVIKKSVNEVATVVNTIAATFEGALCSRRRSLDVLDQLQGINLAEADDDLDIQVTHNEWFPRACECNGMSCVNTSCTPPCPKICTQKNSLDRLSCEGIDNVQGVSINALCDGKIDCLDKTDENNCSYGATHLKYQASGYFYGILNSLKQKAVSQEYLPVQYKLLALHGSVINLQKLSISKNINNDLIITARDRCFSTLISIYEYFLFKSKNEADLDEYYKFLNSIKNELINAMKMANTGNEKLGTMEECICIAGRCGMAHCSKICMKACPVEAKITRYYCENINSNYTVPIELICDGKSDCSNGKDEKDCKQDICRKHHVLLVRQSFENVGQQMKGTAAGEALLSWESKVKQLVKLAERENVTPQLIKKLINDILQKLLVTYGGLNDFRRNAKSTRNMLNKYVDISRKVIETVKLCGTLK